MKNMKKQTFAPLALGVLAVIAGPLALAGCGGKAASEAPATGYAGGQKSGAVDNTTNAPGYANRPHATGAPTSGGR